MPKRVPIPQRRSVRGSVAAALLTASAIASFVVAKGEQHDPPVPVVAIAPSTPSLVHPSARRPGALVVPKPKPKKKKKVVVSTVQTAQTPVVTRSSSTASTASAAPQASTRSTTKKSSSVAADTEFGPG